MIAATTLLGAAQLGGCGGAATLGAAQLTQLRTDIAGARTAAADRDPSAVQSALSKLEREVASLRARGALPAARATALLTEIGQARARVPADVAPAAPAPVAPQLPPAPGPQPGAADGHPHDNGNGKDHGKGHGKGKANGDGGN